ncbi:hypothetical protein ACOMHN_060674 [Nucella lapillus]
MAARSREVSSDLVMELLNRNLERRRGGGGGGGGNGVVMTAEVSNRELFTLKPSERAERRIETKEGTQTVFLSLLHVRKVLSLKPTERFTRTSPSLTPQGFLKFPGWSEKGCPKSVDEGKPSFIILILLLLLIILIIISKCIPNNDNNINHTNFFKHDIHRTGGGEHALIVRKRHYN